MARKCSVSKKGGREDIHLPPRRRMWQVAAGDSRLQLLWLRTMLLPALHSQLVCEVFGADAGNSEQGLRASPPAAHPLARR